MTLLPRAAKQALTLRQFPHTLNIKDSHMSQKPFFFATLIAVTALVASNHGFHRDTGSSMEISSYEYAKLHSAMELPEIAAAARKELKQEYVSIAQYNKIMHRAEAVRLKRSRQMAAVQER